MNARLAEFLISLVNDPEKLTAFNDSENDARREELLRFSQLPEEDKAALRSGNAADVLRRLQATTDGLTGPRPGDQNFTSGSPQDGGTDRPDQSTLAGAIRSRTPLLRSRGEGVGGSTGRPKSAGGQKRGARRRHAPRRAPADRTKGLAGAISRGGLHRPRRVVGTGFSLISQATAEPSPHRSRAEALSPVSDPASALWLHSLTDPRNHSRPTTLRQPRSTPTRRWSYHVSRTCAGDGCVAL